jgi:GH15 family glucan-1,4-alpha-glucosidase
VTGATDGRYPPIASYAAIGDSRTCALVSREGSIDWLCLPRFDSASLFGRLLDFDKGGHFQIVPRTPYAVRRRYIDATNVLETTFSTREGEVGLIDFMPAQREEAKRSMVSPLRAVYRLVECRGGRVPMRVTYMPRPDYGRGGVDLVARSRNTVTAARGRHVTHLHSDVALEATDRDAHADFDVVPGERLRFALTYSLGEPAVLVPPRIIDQVYEQTLAYWRSWTARSTYDGPYHDAVMRSALILKMLEYAPSGAIVAAATTSLPETLGGERNWDYRYCWIRDAAFTVKAFLTMGFRDEAQAFVGWLMHATNLTSPRLAPLYTVHGEPRVPEKELRWLEGYQGSKPVRIGNAAAKQTQFDVYGELIDALHAYAVIFDERFSQDESGFVREVADYVADHWREPDHGIWEPRVPPEHYTHSKVMAWDALDSAAKLAEEGRITGDARRWRAEAEEIRRVVLERGFSREISAFTQTLDGDNLDAAVLTLPLVGFIPANDPRMVSTIDCVQERLTEDGFVRRYEGFHDGLRGEEGAWPVCNFWLSAALAQAGRVDEARAIFERTVAMGANDVGVMAEQYAPATGEALGNTPQALSHIALITAALAIAHAERGDVVERRRWPPAK